MPNQRPAFFVQNNFVERLTAPVALYARERGIALEDRSSSPDLNVDDCGVDWAQYSPVFPYGSVRFLRQVKKSSLARFVLHDEARFATSQWAPIFGRDALNGQGLMVSARDVAQLLREKGTLHLRPDCVDKAFVGGVFDLAQWSALQEDRQLDGDLACWASPLEAIQAEWRCWVVDGLVVEVSQYREDGQMRVRREDSATIWEAAQRLACAYLPAPCVVLDLARVAGRYVLVEFNPIHCSGWYAADVHTALDAWVAWAVREQASQATIHEGRTHLAWGGVFLWA